MKYSMSLVIMSFLALLCAGLINARSGASAVKSSNNFYRVLGKRGGTVALVLFYEESKETKRDASCRCATQELLEMVSAVSNSWFYKAGDLQFLKVNVTKSDLKDLMDEYNVSQLPTFMLFEDGSPLNDNGASVQTSGFISGRELKDFINDNVQDVLQERVDAKLQERERKEALTTYYWYNSPYYYPWCAGYYGGCYGGGYYGRGYGCSRACVGVGFCL